jgi:hypothetical protein
MEEITLIQISLGAIFIVGILFYVKMLFAINKKDHDSFDLDRLKHIEREIAFYPINEQVQYSDIEIRSKMDDYLHIKAYLDGAELDCLQDFTTSTIGNLSYIALFYEGKECRETANSYLQGYKKWVKQNFPTEYQNYINTHGDSGN